MRPARASLLFALFTTAGAVTLTPSCRLVDPILASSEYEVDVEGGTTIHVEFDGGEQVSRLRQRDVVQDLMLDMSGEPEHDAAAFDAMLELESLFESEGYPLVEVQHTVTREAGRISVRFDIQAGSQVTVSSLKIEGNDSVPGDTLLQYWRRRQTGALGFGDNIYILADLEALTDAIQTHYRRLGYLDASAELLPPAPPLTPGVDVVAITVRVTEGELYHLAELVIDPELAKDLGPGAESPHAAPRPGAPFLAKEIQDHALEISYRLRRLGHPDPEVLTTVTPDPQAHTVAVRIHGEAGPAVQVEKVTVRGNSYVDEDSIRDRIKVSTGTKYDGKTEEESVLRLYQSGLFRRVRVNRIPTGPDAIELEFEVEEAERYLVQPMIGYGSYEQLRAGLEFEMLQFLASDFDFNAKGVISMKGHRAVITLSDNQFLPSLFGDDTTFSIAADHFRREEPSYVDGAFGISPSLSHRFTRRLSARVAYIFREHSDTKSSVIDPGALIGDYTEGSALAELTFDSRDSPLMPRQGIRSTLQYKHFAPGLGGDVDFDRFRAGLSTVWPLHEDVHFALRGEASWLVPRAGSDAIPIQERLFNGGESTVRSFREDQLATLALRDVNGQPVGGEYTNVINAELRWAPPLQPLEAIKLEFALFGDVGNVGKFVEDYGFDHLKYGVGAGLRFLLPIGPVRFDVAHNPEAEVFERDWTLHFSIGYPF